MTTQGEILQRAKEHIQKGWTQGCEARQEDGGECGAADPRAVCFCLVGGIAKAAFELKFSPDAHGNLIRRISRFINQPIIPWNDAPGRTQKEVIELINKMIAQVST